MGRNVPDRKAERSHVVLARQDVTSARSTPRRRTLAGEVDSSRHRSRIRIRSSMAALRVVAGTWPSGPRTQRTDAVGQIPAGRPLHATGERTAASELIKA